MKRYEAIVNQIGIMKFLNKNLQKDSLEYKDIKRQILKIKEEDAKKNLYETGKRFYELTYNENSFYHCKKRLKKEGIEENKTKEVIWGAIICYLINFMLRPKVELTEIHHEALDDILEIEYVEYLESLF